MWKSGEWNASIVMFGQKFFQASGTTEKSTKEKHVQFLSMK